MSKKNSIITYALVGLAAGTVAWLLLGTKEGRKQLSCASDGIKDLAASLRKETKKGMEKASKFADKASKEINSLANQAKASGNRVLDEAEREGKKTISRAQNTAKSIKSKAENA